jgi:phosphoenolpyruvate carboxykinase (GTP)
MTIGAGRAVRPTHAELCAWVDEVAALTMPDDVVWCDGSQAEWDRLTDELVQSGTLVRLDERKKPNSFLARTDPDDAARAEDRTFVCSRDEADAGPTNNWVAPAEMKSTMAALYHGAMIGRTMYVVPFCMGQLDAKVPMFGVEITDSPYVVCSTRLMTRMGAQILERMGERAPFVKCLHSVGAPLAPGERDVPWPCNATKFIAHFPEERAIWSYGSAYGGNSLLGKKCYALRIASAMARDEGWLAEHMLILKLSSPEKRVHYVAAAFPSACGKTNLAMLEPTIPGWRVETVGDDVAWLRFGDDGRLYAVNPEYGFFGVAPGTGWDTNPNAMRTIAKGNCIFTNVALTGDGDVWWEGCSDDKPDGLTTWLGESWIPSSDKPAAHPNSRFCTPIKQCPILAPEYGDPCGVPISAILFGGRRGTTIPLVVEARDWNHGVFMGATLSSETTAAATGTVGVVRRDPMAMLPFLVYHVGDYFAHWMELAKTHDESRLPRIFQVNWFRRGEDGRFLWPGFGENGRVLKWIVERIDGTAAAVTTPIGLVPANRALDVSDLMIDDADVAEALDVDAEEWRSEIPLIKDWFEKMGDRLPAQLRTELTDLEARLG